MKQCPSCKRELEDHLIFCPFDGEPLGVRVTNEFVGILLDDKYRLEEKVGEGGMGTVYRATHIQMENTVAVKILRPDLASDQTAVERFRREARSTAQIRHPNAVAVTDFGVTRDAGIAYLVMEFLEGEDLRHKIKQKRRLDLEETALILSQTCSAVSAAHFRGIIHRDLKPDNIWLIKTEEGVEHVKVLDFGIAKLKASTDVSLTQGAIIGTPYYMSPEQCRGEELDPGSDVYSLGVILYEMLTGRVPFDGSNPLAVVLKHSTEHPRRLRELRPDIPEQVERVVLRALEKKREDRQTSAVQLAQEFEAALPSEGSTRDFGSSVALAQRAAPIPSVSTTVIVDPASRQAVAGEASQPSSGRAHDGKSVYAVDANRSVDTKTSEASTPHPARTLNRYAIVATFAMLLIGVVAIGVLTLSAKSQSESISKSIYRLRATVVDPQGMPVEDAKLWSSIGGEAKKVAGGWQFDIPVASKPAGGELTIYASKETAFLSGKQDAQLGEDLNPALMIQLSKDTSASVTGFIEDSQGRAVSGARVSIIGSADAVFITEADGNFSLPAHAAITEPVKVRVEKEGFKPWVEWRQALENPATIKLERR